MIASSLLALAAALVVAGAHLRRVRLFDAAPRLGVFAWQALSLTALASVALAGLTLVVPASSMGGDLASMLRACVFTLQAAYAAPTELPGVTAGVALASTTTVWPAGWVLWHLFLARRERRAALDSLTLVSRDDVELGVTVVDTDVAAAYCLPGRHGRIILTSAAVSGLDREELAAVIAHERAHLRERHHVPVAVAKGLARAFPMMPLFAAAATEIGRLVEMRADDAAARDTDQISVAAALVALAGMRAPRAALAAAHTAGAIRVRRLLEPAGPVGIGRPLTVLVALTLVLVAPALIAAYPAFAAANADLCTLPPVAR
ncbi:MAG TPA: M56 family metallopeptidase [Mycobacteriales bacterium]|nr:M56 family metallopeptidase [Mycobacteriales bacterium]